MHCLGRVQKVLGDGGSEVVVSWSQDWLGGVTIDTHVLDVDGEVPASRLCVRQPLQCFFVPEVSIGSDDVSDQLSSLLSLHVKALGVFMRESSGLALKSGEPQAVSQSFGEGDLSSGR